MTFSTSSRFGDKKLVKSPKLLSEWAINLEVGMLHGPWKGGWDTDVGRSNCIQPNIRILVENPLADKDGHKNGLSLAPIFDNFYVNANEFFV